MYLQQNYQWSGSVYKLLNLKIKHTSATAINFIPYHLQHVSARRGYCVYRYVRIPITYYCHVKNAVSSVQWPCKFTLNYKISAK